MTSVTNNQTPPSGQMVRWVGSLDSFQTVLTRQISFLTLQNYLQAADDGDLLTGLRLYWEIERRDLHLRGVARTRRLALTGLDWEVVSAADTQADIEDRSLADDAAAFVRERLSRLPGFETALEHMASGIGPNLAVCEIEWSGSRVAAVHPVPYWRLEMEPHKSADVLVRIDQGTTVPATGLKWIKHVPEIALGVPIAGSLSRTSAIYWLIKTLAIADWATFCEKFGMPFRTAVYKSGATKEEKDELKDMLENHGSNGWMMVSEAVSLALQESSGRGVQPFEALEGHCDRKLSIAWLGGHLSVDTAQSTGTYAAGKVQDEVRDDIRDDDIRRESRTIMDQLISPIVRHGFRPDAPLPTFRRIKPETVDRMAEAQLIKAGTQELGLPVEQSHVYDRLGIPAPEIDEATGLPVHPTVKRIAVNPFEGDA